MENDNSILYKNKKIHYRIIGKGNPIIFIHGFCEDGNIWNELLPYLETNYKLIVPDLPGSGKSELLEGDNISLEDYAEVIKSILDRENIKRCTIIGHSMGGYIALAFAEKYPGLLNGLGLFHSSAFADDEEKKQTRLKSINFIKEKGVYQYLKTSVPNLFADKQHPKIETLIGKGNSFTSEALIQYLNAMMNRPDRTNILKSFNKPVLFIIGEKDTAVPLEASLKQCHKPAIAHVHILKDVAHMGMVEATSASAGMIADFLQNI